MKNNICRIFEKDMFVWIITISNFFHFHERIKRSNMDKKKSFSRMVINIFIDGARILVMYNKFFFIKPDMLGRVIFMRDFLKSSCFFSHFLSLPREPARVLRGLLGRM